MDLHLTWGQAADATRGALRRGDAGAPLRSFSTDSRRLEPGQAFWVLRGGRYDAHDFLAELGSVADGWVVREGAQLPEEQPRNLLTVPDTTKALSDLAYYHRARFDIPVVGITGSNGKTTVKDMLSSILGVAGPVCATEGNFNNEIGLPLSVLELTPAHRAAVFEMGASREGDIRHLCGIARPTVGVLTNIAPAHLEFFGDIEGVFRTKCELVDSLPSDALLALNADDPLLARLRPRLADRAVTFGAASDARVRIVPTSGKRSLCLEIDGESVTIPGDTYGPLQRINAAGAAAAALALHAGIGSIVKGLAAYRPSPLRFDARTHPSGCRFIVDTYNANPASMRAGITAFLELTRTDENILVLGDMAELGKDAPSLHSELGDWLAGLSLAGVYLAGPLMKNAYDGLHKAGPAFPYVHCEDPYGLTAVLQGRLAQNVSVYFKASRTMRLERLAEGV